VNEEHPENEHTQRPAATNKQEEMMLGMQRLHACCHAATAMQSRSCGTSEPTFEPTNHTTTQTESKKSGSLTYAVIRLQQAMAKARPSAASYCLVLLTTSLLHRSCARRTHRLAIAAGYSNAPRNSTLSSPSSPFDARHDDTQDT
jgi:hypothetical protein